jgi:cell division initiation protein
VKVTPLDIRKKEFRRSVRGYLDEDVDVFLDTVADEVERIAKVNAELQKKVQSLEDEIAGHAHIREALEKTLVAAQLQSEEIRTNARKESESMLRDAEAKAKAVVDDFYAQTQAAQQTLMQLKLLEEDFRFKFKALLEGYLKLVEDGPLLFTGLEVDSAGTASAKTQGARAAAKAAPVGKASAADESPTSETMEEAFGPKADNTVSAASEPAVPAPLPPHLPKTVSVVKTRPTVAEDLTVETTVLASRDAAERPSKPAVGSEGENNEGGVYFGRKEDDPDDPFPEIGGDPEKPRDFAW